MEYSTTTLYIIKQRSNEKKLQASITFANMTFESRWNVFDSQCFEHAKYAAEHGIFIDENGVKKAFWWMKRDERSPKVGQCPMLRGLINVV